MSNTAAARVGMCMYLDKGPDPNITSEEDTEWQMCKHIVIVIRNKCVIVVWLFTNQYDTVRGRADRQTRP